MGLHFWTQLAIGNAATTSHHNQANHRSSAEEHKLPKKLIWFQKHHNTALAHHLQHSADISYDDIKHWPRPTKWARLQLLEEAAQRCFILQHKQAAKKQRVLPAYFWATHNSEWAMTMILPPAATLCRLVSGFPCVPELVSAPNQCHMPSPYCTRTKTYNRGRMKPSQNIHS